MKLEELLGFINYDTHIKLISSGSLEILKTFLADEKYICEEYWKYKITDISVSGNEMWVIIDTQNIY